MGPMSFGCKGYPNIPSAYRNPTKPGPFHDSRGRSVGVNCAFQLNNSVNPIPYTLRQAANVMTDKGMSGREHPYSPKSDYTLLPASSVGCLHLPP